MKHIIVQAGRMRIDMLAYSTSAAIYRAMVMYPNCRKFSARVAA